MNRLPLADRVRILAALVEGSSIRGTARMVGVDKKTVLRLLADVGDACAVYMDENLRGLACKRIQCDEIWSFVHAKARNVPEHLKNDEGVGDLWTWIAMDEDTKLVVCWLLAKREPWAARLFIRDLSERVVGHVQITTDGQRMYIRPIEQSFGADADYAQVVKLYGNEKQERGPETRYSPMDVTGFYKKIISGNPEWKHIATSHLERQNLTIRMSSRRFTRLTNAFSKKAENLQRALALHFMHYNFCRRHQTLRTTPAIAAGITDRIWTLHDIANLADVLTDSAA